MPDLRDRVALVTGAARGTGAAIASRFADVGARVVLCDVLVDAGQARAAEIGDAARFLPLDVTSEQEWSRVVEETLAAWGR
ncbi:MAG: SDR family NAD(P)-dependent oxidoreductase, partial [Deltaproteobacteria bacterium]|nr:SDR family NAD(P)-dependent oxidoreductase [Deltaproteobacteria bacterium]